MAECAAELVAAGADGIVTGVLTPAGALDTDALRPIYAAARQAAEKAHRTVDCTLHRAFDVCCGPFAALEAAKQLGLATILTSGQAASAPQGAALLRQLVEAAGQEVEILVGAGVSADNIPALAAQTGARAFHLSGKQVLDSRMTFRRQACPWVCRAFRSSRSGRPARRISAPPVPHWMRYNRKTKSFTGLPAVPLFPPGSSHCILPFSIAPSRENAKSGSPQTARICSTQMSFPLNMPKAKRRAFQFVPL